MKIELYGIPFRCFARLGVVVGNGVGGMMSNSLLYLFPFWVRRALKGTVTVVPETAAFPLWG